MARFIIDLVINEKFQVVEKYDNDVDWLFTNAHFPDKVKSCLRGDVIEIDSKYLKVNINLNRILCTSLTHWLIYFLFLIVWGHRTNCIWNIRPEYSVSSYVTRWNAKSQWAQKAFCFWNRHVFRRCDVYHVIFKGKHSIQYHIQARGLQTLNRSGFFL